MAATRIYILAKELGVKSTAIVEKCQAEGLDVKNHMAAISAGLAATIREWFSEGEHTTTEEVTGKVDLKKVRVKKKAKRKPPAKKVAPEVDAPETADQEEIKPEPESEPEPELIVPAGPMLEKPEPAKLSGPKLVRVEKPEPHIARRPKPRTKVRTKPAKARVVRDAPVTEPLMQSAPKELTVKKTASGAKKHAGKHKDRTHGRRSGTEQVQEVSKRAKFDAQRRQRDIEERRARLNAADGTGTRVRLRRRVATKAEVGANVIEVVRPTEAAIPEPVMVKELSAVLKVKTSDVIYKLMQQGVMVTANQIISPDVAEIVAIDFGCELTVERKSTAEELIHEEFENRQKTNLSKRPVVVTMLGHVDHGKTSLLDKIRSTQVTAGEAGGITQHISAYQVKIDDSRVVTFLDTPGHAAFTAMRARGANMTDVVVLVVAADDGVMPQTVEVINHAKAAQVQVIVALNKSDLPGCDINRIYSQLAEHELVPVEWGGKTEVVKTSALTGEGIEDLLEHLDYIADLLELQADNTIPAAGWVVEAEMSAKRGVIATFLLKEGRLDKGDVVLAGTSFGRVKTLRNSFGKNIRNASSSMPVEITGLNEVPQAGDRFYCLGKDINRAKSIAEENQIRSRESSLAERTQVTLDNLFSQIEAGSVKDLNIIIRADVDGSIDVLKKYLSELSTEEVKIKILHAATGGITEGDVSLAEASNAIIIGFNVISEDHVAKSAEEKGVDIRLYTIIYRITEDLEKSMTGLLEPDKQQRNIGRAMIRNIFKVSRLGTIAGCYVSDGVARKAAKVHLVRDNVVLRDDLTIDTLKHFKDDVREVKSGLECGIKLRKFDDVKIDDMLDFFEIVEVARTLR